MANTNLGHSEIKNLREGLAVAYEKKELQTLALKRSRKQYETLCKHIREQNKPRDPNASVSEDQLMSLFTDNDKTTFKDDFIDSCYFYAYQQTQKSYRNEHKKQVEEWTYLDKQNQPDEPVINTKTKTWLYALGGLVLGLSTVFFNTCRKTEPIMWYMTTTWDGNTSFICEALRGLTAEVNRETKGEFRIMISNNLQLPDSGQTKNLSDIFKILSSDAENPRIQMLHSSKYFYHTQQSPNAIFFSAIPFGMDYQQTKKWMGDKFLDSERNEWGEGYKFWCQANEKLGLISFPCGHSDAQWGGWYKKPIERIEDFRGKKIRISGFAGSVLNSLGATTYSMHQYQLLQAMQSDSLFAAEWINAVDDYRMGLYKARSYKFINDEIWNEPNSMFSMTINGKAFDNLPERYQKALVNAIKHMNEGMIAEFTGQGQSEKYKALIAKEGVQYFKFKSEIRDTLEKTTRRLLYEHVQKNKKKCPEIDEIYESYLRVCPNLRYSLPQ